jgi:hypothetical protein
LADGFVVDDPISKKTEEREEHQANVNYELLLIRNDP